MADLPATETRIWSILEPYRDRVDASTIYGMPSQVARREGARSLRRGERRQELRQPLPARGDTYPDALEGTSPDLLRRRTGKAAFNFATLDDNLAHEPEQLLGRLFDRYEAAHAGR